MFRYYKSAFKNAKPQLLKALLFALISFAVCFIVYRFASAFIAQFSTQMQMLQQFGQSVSLTMYIPIIIIYLILALLFIFLGYQLLAGAINVIQKAMKHEKIKFSDLFFAFKKGRYATSLLLALISVVAIMIMFIIAYLLKLLYNVTFIQLYAWIQQSVSNVDNSIAILIISQIVIILLMGFITSIVYWFFLTFMINYTVAFAEDPHRKAMSNVKEGFNGIKNGKKTWLKFFIGILLLNLVVLITGQPLITLFSYLTSHMSQSVAQILAYVVLILIILIRIVIYFIILMGIIYYFITRGDKIDKPGKKARKGKKNDKDSLATSKDDNKGKTSNVKEKVQDKVNDNDSKDDNLKDKAENQFNNQKDNASSKGQDLKDKASEKVSDNKDDITDRAKDTFDKK